MIISDSGLLFVDHPVFHANIMSETSFWK